jgi:hypothetical protein
MRLLQCRRRKEVKLICRLPLVGALLIAISTAQADPLIHDKTMAQKLLGKHALTLQWLGSGTLKDAGNVEIKAENGAWHLSGRQETKEGHVSLDGIVTAIDATTFGFTGKIITNVSYINQGKDCLRDGDFTFAKKGTRKYWRLQQIDNPCDQAADYVDIYLR